MQPTKRQSEYLDFIRAFTERWGIPPSFEDISVHFGTTTPAVNGMVKTLEARGFLTRVPGAARTLRVLVAKTPEARSPRRSGNRDETLRADSATAAAVADVVRFAELVIERLVPALKGVDDHHLHNALHAVASAVDVTCVAEDATPDQRTEAFESLRRVALIARGMSPERGPRRPKVRTRRR